jgi:hypothetical protein
MTAARRALAALGLLVLAAVLTAPPAGAALRPLARRPTDGPSSSPQALAYAVPEAPPYTTAQGHFLVHYVTTTTDAPALTDVAGPDGAPGPDGIPDVVEQVGAEAESALATETGFGYRAPPPDNLDGIQRGGDGRYDIYLLSFGGHGLNGVVGLTVNDPGGSNGSYEVIDSDYSGLVGSRFSADEERRVTIAHELFHAIQLGYVAGGLPTWIAEATAVWMETQVYPSIPDNLSFLPALDGAWSEQPLWETGHLHEYGSWLFIRYMATVRREGTGWVRHLLEQFAADSHRHERDLGVATLARASGGTRRLSGYLNGYGRVLEATFGSSFLPHRIVALARKRTLAEPLTRLLPLETQVWRLEPKGRRLQVEVQPRGGQMLAGDLSLQVGRRVVAAQPSAGGTFTLTAPVPAADAHDVRLVVTRATPSAVSYRLRLSD